jgi:aspartate racemase
MGPLAGVHLQRLIIEATPASKDQDHIQVVCFTNPQIPDRTASLAADGGDAYVEAIIVSIKVLEAAGATHIVIPCNTSHARVADIQNATKLPILDLIETALLSAREVLPGGEKIGLLATQGTINTNVYQRSELGKKFAWILPAEEEQKKIMDVIYDIKAGKSDGIKERLSGLIEAMKGKGAQAVILGCTELSLYFEPISARENIAIIDPLRAMASRIVNVACRESSN